jgi:hypothetical protein
MICPQDVVDRNLSDVAADHCPTFRPNRVARSASWAPRQGEFAHTNAMAAAARRTTPLATCT